MSNPGVNGMPADYDSRREKWRKLFESVGPEEAEIARDALWLLERSGWMTPCTSYMTADELKEIIACCGQPGGATTA